MSLIANAVDGLIGAALSATVGVVAIRRSKPSKQEYDDAWKKQAGELQDALGEQTQQRITYLEAQCENKDREIARLQRELGRAQQGRPIPPRRKEIDPDD